MISGDIVVLISGMVVGLVQKRYKNQSNVVGVWAQLALITVVRCGSGESVTATGIIRVVWTVNEELVGNLRPTKSHPRVKLRGFESKFVHYTQPCIFFLCGETCAKYDTFFLLFGILNISEVMRSPDVLYGIH